MITRKNLKDMLGRLGYIQNGVIFEKTYDNFDCSIRVNMEREEIIYPEEKGMHIIKRTTCNFSDPENFVVLECVTRLFDKGYRPEHIELEKEWQVGHDGSGRADIVVKDKSNKTLFIVECKTFGSEYRKELNNTLSNGGQLFTYWQQDKNCKWLLLYSCNLDGEKFEYAINSIDCSDDKNILVSAKKDPTIGLYQNANTAEELFKVWDRTYEKRFSKDVVFRDDTQAYRIGIRPWRKKDLRDFSREDKIVNKFEEILRHNNVSDKENAFNRLIVLFICKLVDEIQKDDEEIVEFQYKIGTDTYESLQDRLQRLYKEGMEKFMREDIFYISDHYAEDLVQQYFGNKREKMIEDLKATLRILKFYTNSDFAFKDVHNEELFFQNGKILVEVVQLFQEYKIVESNDLQMLGDLFEQLLNKGFKQNEGQFFTPIPIARFIWDSLPLDRIIKHDDAVEFPKIIDYACGAGHFLTQGFEAVNDFFKREYPAYKIPRSWPEKKIYGIEKDYRLARVSKVSLFMHGAGDGNIIFGDGLENYKDKNIIPNTFDILVANPPYSVSAFKPHLKLKENDFSVLPKISNNGSEIETLFVERIAQILKPGGIAAVILPGSILNKETESFIAVRELIFTNFYIKAVVQLGSKTFGETGINTVVLFLEKFREPPKRMDFVMDSVFAIWENQPLDDWEDKNILSGYLDKIGVDRSTYRDFITRARNYMDWMEVPYFSQYVSAFKSSAECVGKEKQKSFIKAAEEEKRSWYHQHFYDYVAEREKEKIMYFALSYQQNTLVIAMPDENKEQEEFLGYKWSKRKGQEGIQIINPGGLLYHETDRKKENTISAIVRHIFAGEEIRIRELEKYYYYLRLQDMIDFSGVSFNKSIRLTRTRNFRETSGTTPYKLDGKEFDISIGNRVLSAELAEDGAFPVYSANVFEEFGRINKQNLTDFSKASILWGIDGDWMVNCIPAGQPFYPTDHCGVLRLNTEEIMPEYMAIALQVEGIHEKFSRSNRASTKRIKSLTILIPERKIQERIVQEISAIDKAIREKEERTESLLDDIKSRFSDMFKGISALVSIGDCCNVEKGATLTRENAVKGEVPVVAGGKMPSCYHNIANRPANIITISASGANAGFVSFWDVPIFAADCNTIICKNMENFAIEYVYLALLMKQDEIYRLQKGAGQPHVYGKDIEKILIAAPSKKQQDKFAEYFREFSRKNSRVKEEKEKLRAVREDMINKYFE